MPLTAKGTEILSVMQKEYGEKEGERVFYASRNAGVVSGVDSEYELTGKSVFNLDDMAEQISSLGSEAKRLAERMDGSFEDAAFQLGMKHGEAGLPMIDYKKTFDAKGAEAYEKGYKGGQGMRRK